MRLTIERDWQGTPVPPLEHAWVEIELGQARARGSQSVVVSFDAPYYADPPPPLAAGPTPGLWDYEVIELFVADAGEHYFELELGPHGHHLALELCGVRKVARERLPLVYSVTIEPGTPFGRYRGRAEVPMSYLPAAPTRVNAYTIHGAARAPARTVDGPHPRTYRAHAPVPGAAPDFHRLSCFVPIRS